jgi:hypothetical protein
MHVHIYIYYNSKTACGFLPVDVCERMKTPLNNANANRNIYIHAFNFKNYADRERVSHNIYIYICISLLLGRTDSDDFHPEHTKKKEKKGKRRV